MPKEETKVAVERNLVYGAQAREAVAAKKGEAPLSSREADPHKLAQRLKQVEYGYNTLGYHNYRKEVPKAERTPAQPKTPERTKVMSKRAWEGLIRKWRRQLHEWDPQELQGVRGAGAAAHARAADDAADVNGNEAAADAASVATTRGARCSPSDDDDDGLVACRPPSDEDEDNSAGPMSLAGTPEKAAAPPSAAPGEAAACAREGGGGPAAGVAKPRDLAHDCFGDFAPEGQS